MLTLPWTARFKDGSVICQYDQVNNKGSVPDELIYKENLFKEVLDRQDDLVLFFLVNQKNKDIFLVDLINGCISKTTGDDKMLHPRADMLRKDQYKYRLIYFREVAKHFSSSMQYVSEDIVYFIGFQYTDENNKNHKRMIKIQEDGKWVVN